MEQKAILKKISISGKIIGNFFLNEIEQVFENKTKGNVEFVYTFPIPASASVSSFSAKTASGLYNGIVQKKEEALKIYQDALTKGDSAYMLESYRDNIFQVSLGNVAEDEEVMINISYIQDLVVDDNEIRLLIPTLVSPRYIPGHSIGGKKGMGGIDPTNEVPDADFITPEIGETDYKVDFNIDFQLDNKIKEITSPSHKIKVDFEGGNGKVKVEATKADSDFVLNFALLGTYNEKLVVSVFTPPIHFQSPKDYDLVESGDGAGTNAAFNPINTDEQVEGQEGINAAFNPSNAADKDRGAKKEYFIYATFIPKFSELSDMQTGCLRSQSDMQTGCLRSQSDMQTGCLRSQSDMQTGCLRSQKGKEFIYLLDVSGSMSGQNLESAKKALKVCLRNMDDTDDFNIIAFESYYEYFQKNSVPFNETTFKKADKWIDMQRSRGGTEIFGAMKYAIESVNKNSEKEKIIMILTDGQIGNEDTIIKYVQKNFEGRVFCVGIDVNVNDSFLNKVSQVGNGFAEFYYPRSNENLANKVIRQFARTSAPVLTDIKYEIEGNFEIAGKPQKYLYENECYNLLFKTDSMPKSLIIKGKMPSFSPHKSQSEIGTTKMGGHIEIPVSEKDYDAKLLSKMWAKKRMTDMDLQAFSINPRHEKIQENKIIELSTKYGVLCRYTGFIAVNTREDKQDGLPEVVAVKVDKPREMDLEIYNESVLMSRISPMSKARKLINVQDDSSDKDYGIRDSLQVTTSNRMRYQKPNLKFDVSDKSSIPPFLQKYFDDEKVSKEKSNKKTSIIDFLNSEISEEDFTPKKFKKDMRDKILTLEKEIKKIDFLNSEISEEDFTPKKIKKDMRDKILSLGKVEDTIIFRHYFAEIDKILSLVEPFIEKGDTELDNCYQKLVKKLDKACIINDLKVDISELAALQNFDGSFCLCKPLKIKYSQMMLKRFKDDVDASIYQKQIEKLEKWIIDNGEWNYRLL